VREAYGGDFRQGSTWLAIGDMAWIVPARGNLWRYLNHSCEPNVALRGTRTIVARRPIAAGEELLIDYATTEADPFWHLHCRCRAAACRGIIGGVLSLPPHVYVAYRADIPQFLRDYRRRNRRLGRETRRSLERLQRSSARSAEREPEAAPRVDQDGDGADASPS
jgi:hypothetical protein